MLLPILLLILAHFILLLLRLEHVSNLSLFVVGIPAFVAYGVGALVFLGLALLLRAITLHDRLLMVGFFFLLVGSLVSQILVADKFETNGEISWTGALVPFMAGVLAACILVAAGLWVKARAQPAGESIELDAPLLPRSAPRPSSSHAPHVRLVAVPARSGAPRRMK